MRRSRTVGRSARAAWVTRAEAAFLASVDTRDVDRWIATGRLPARTVGGVVLVDLSSLDDRTAVAPPPEARSVRGARARSDRARRLPKADRPADPPKAGKAPQPPRAPKQPKAQRQPKPPRRAKRPKAQREPKPPRRAKRPKAQREPRKPRRTKGPRTPLLDRPLVVIGGAAAVTTVALLLLQFTLFGGASRRVPLAMAAPRASSPVPATPSIPVGRDPFADPFGTTGKGDRSGGVLVKPPGVVRQGDFVTAATTVVNQDDTRWLPPSQLTFVARDGNGRVIARTSTTVSLGPGKAETIVAPDLGVDPSAIAAIEAHIRPAPLRSGRYHAPDVNVVRAAATDDGKAITGALSIGRGAPSSTTLACAMFDGLDELAGVTTKTVDLGAARSGRLRFWLTAQPTTPGHYKVSCSVSSPAPSAG